MDAVDLKIRNYNSSIKYPKQSGAMYYEREDQIVLCHGSKDIIRNPQYGLGEASNDYGRGFYTVFEDNIELAKEWACSPYNRTDQSFVNTYTFDTRGIKVLNLDKMPIIYWIVLAASMREPNVDEEDFYLLQDEYLVDTSLFDCVYGWRCDDSYSQIMDGFIDGRYSDLAVEQAMKLGYLQTQFVIISENAFGRIKYKKNEVVKDFSLYREKFEDRRKKAEAGLTKIGRDYYGRGKLYVHYVEELKNESR